MPPRCRRGALLATAWCGTRTVKYLVVGEFLITNYYGLGEFLITNDYRVVRHEDACESERRPERGGQPEPSCVEGAESEEEGDLAQNSSHENE